MTTIGLVILCMIILVISQKRRARKRSEAHDSDSVTMLTPEGEMVESSVGHGTRDSGHSMVELVGHPPVEHALDHQGWTPLLKPAYLALRVIRELGFDHGNDVPVGRKFPSCLPVSHSNTSPPAPNPKGVRGSYPPSIDSFYGAT